jgi:uncharacterized protein with PIN domain
MDMNFDNPEFTEKLSNPASFKEMLAGADEVDDLDEDAADAVEELEDEDEDEADAEEEIDDEPDADDEEEHIDPEKEKSLKVLRQKANYEAQRAERAEADLAALKHALQEYAANQQKQSDDDGLPETEEDRLEQMQRQNEQRNFQTALNMADMQARQKYPDFEQSYKHLMNTKVQEFIAISGASENQAQEQAMRFMQGVAHNAYRQNRDIGDTFYGLAKVSGYSAKQEAKGLNPKAIEKNRAKTEKRRVKPAAVDVMDTSDIMATLEGITKAGRGVDTKAFKKLLAAANAN